MSVSPIKQRLRITFGKYDTLKYTGNLDIAKIWERVLRRAHLPVLYSKGFNTRPRIALALALPLGITSDCEMLDVMLKEILSEDDFPAIIEQLQAVSPAGLKIYSITTAHPLEEAMENRVHSARYEITFPDGIDNTTLQQKLETLLAQEKIIKVTFNRKRRKSVQDIRPLIHELHVNEAQDGIDALLSVGKYGNMRPDKLLEELGLDDEYYSVHRKRLLYT
ncbi:MAG: TIGR03936 family radical SAM-associated protein [Aggregatilineales bacterium]